MRDENSPANTLATSEAPPEAAAASPVEPSAAEPAEGAAAAPAEGPAAVPAEAAAAPLAEGAAAVPSETATSLPPADLQLLSLIAEHTTDAALRLDGKGRVLYVNASFRTVFGYQPEEILNGPVSQLLTKNSLRLFEQKLSASLRARRGERGQSTAVHREMLSLRALHKDGRQLPVEAFLILHRQGAASEILLLVKDQTHQETVAQELKAVRNSYAALTETVTDPILQINQSFKILFANTAVRSVFGYTAGELVNRDLEMLFPPSLYGRYMELFRKYFIIDDADRKASQLENTLEVLGQNKFKEVVNLEISFGNSRSVSGERLLTCIVRDISQRKKTERRLKYLAYHDKLTNLGNRDLFYITLDQFLAHVQRYSESIGALLFLDLDGFKKVNDNLGHDIGDKILCECAHRLGSCLRESDHVYRFTEELEQLQGSHEDLFRFGGDEFVIMLPHLRRTTDAAVVAQKIVETLREPFHLEGVDNADPVNIGVSIGIALIPENGTEAMQLIRSADVAMYKAKERRNCYLYFTRELNKQATERMFLENGLRRALESNSLEVHYQPIVRGDGSIEGVEALLRWRTPQKGLISPGVFIPVAEETGMILAIGDWVFEQTCRQLKEWNGSGFPDLYASVNFSVRQFNQEDMVEKLGVIIGRTGVNPKNLKIEVTESSIMRNPEEARARMTELKRRYPGVRIAIDDFGTGYSSLSYLSDFPVDILKIDQHFVIDLKRQHNTRIINTIITLGQSLNLEVVAEGVETERQLDYLSARQCHAFQGFFFAKPVPAGEMSQLLQLGRLPLDSKSRTLKG
jgi:diguanylate cyclase (GGDEF)-like protein/PAS domain S-box-containing protein